MYPPNPDSLGVGLRSRADEYRRSLVDDRGRARLPLGVSGSVMPFRDWDAMFQGLDEAGVENVAQSPSMPPLPSTIDPNLPQTGLREARGASQHIGNVEQMRSRALDGLRRFRPEGPFNAQRSY